MSTTQRTEEAKPEVETFRKDDVIDAEHTFDPIAFDAAAAKWYGSARDRMREIGFETTDEFITAIRGR